ncbi:cobalamin biosynthesis protein CbiA [Myxococcota bacterium]|nr:cobalamin biosynthesis protein CbiA [Myxococcota bacterium]MBU1381257.1 cobalamin biosynthesis protein CbiA [Myxococcota bacterium]MBU1499217.1 cobalamin biosynthesis protein CbiA [Myxococcota bacterium]
MNMTAVKNPIVPRQRAVIVIGHYGSGKSEVSVNLALHFKSQGIENVSIADLDVVNPYFRSREAITPLEKEGISVIVPRGGHYYADLPILLPEVKGLFENHKGTAVFDAGGDDVGCRILASLGPSIGSNELLMVVNNLRPYTNTIENTMEMMRKLEKASKLKITGFIGNAHLMEDTSEDIVMDGVDFLRKLSDHSGIETRFITVPELLFEVIAPKVDDVSLLVVKRILQPPWKPGEYNFRKKHEFQV